MNNSPLRVAVIGCGVISPTHAGALTALPEARLVAFSDSVPEKALALARQYDVRALSLEETLADSGIDAVTICVPSGLHAEVGIQALIAGKHVVIEKPMDVSLAACDALLAAQTRSGKTLAIVSQHRFDPATIAVRQAMQNGELGSLVYADARIPWYRTQEYYDSGNWRGTWALDGGGALMNQGVHTVDLMRWLCGPVETVYAQARTLAHKRIEAEDILAATLTFANGALGSVIASTALYPGFPARLAVHGTEGSAVIEGDTLQTFATKSGTELCGEAAHAHALHIARGGTQAATAAVSAAPMQQAAADPAALWGGSHQDEIADFVRCCRTGETPVVDGIEGRKAVEVVLAIYESARTGQVVRL